MPIDSLPMHVRVLCVGAGFGGLGLAIKLRERGERDFLVIDKGDEVGGTWRANSYPGAACDVPSQLYSFSFAPNPRWTRSYSSQREIWAYLRRLADQTGVRDHFRFATEFIGATWDEAGRRWQVRTSAGDLTADVLVSAAGALSEPQLPPIAGLTGFAGTVMHTACWDHTVELAGKRVAVIGTGASAIQIIPEVAKVAAHLDVFQRTPPWVISRKDRAYSPFERWAFHHLPWLQKVYRTGVYLGRESSVPAFILKPELGVVARRDALANLRRSITDPDLLARLTPDYAIGCKRILLSNDYYPALARDNVTVVTDPITTITRTGVVTSDGTGHLTDVLILATGFRATNPPILQTITGSDGLTLAQAYARSSASAYKGTTVHGFPNLFQLTGPNTGLGHSSMVFMIESQLAYILSALDAMQTSGHRRLEVRRQAQDRWSTDIQRRMKRTVWQTGGCASWYLDRRGRNITLWPRSTFAFRWLLRRFDRDAYELA